MLKMTYALAKALQYERVNVRDASGTLLGSYDGTRTSDAFVLGHDWLDHRVYCINPRTELHDGQVRTELDVWIEA